MKKYLAFLIAAMAVIFASAGVSSCSKDSSSDSLVGTTWTASTDGGTATLTFATETTFTLTERYDGDIDRLTGTYTRRGNTISLTADGITISGTINGNTMTIIDDGYPIVFTKI